MKSRGLNRRFYMVSNSARRAFYPFRNILGGFVAHAKFFLIDQSTNGTFVLIKGSERAYLRREELALRGTGVISLGRAVSEDSPEAIHFACLP